MYDVVGGAPLGTLGDLVAGSLSFEYNVPSSSPVPAFRCALVQFDLHIHAAPVTFWYISGMLVLFVLLFQVNNCKLRVKCLSHSAESRKAWCACRNSSLCEQAGHRQLSKCCHQSGVGAGLPDKSCSSPQRVGD